MAALLSLAAWILLGFMWLFVFEGINSNALMSAPAQPAH